MIATISSKDGTPLPLSRTKYESVYYNTYSSDFSQKKRSAKKKSEKKVPECAFPLFTCSAVILLVFDRGKGVPSFDEMMDIALVEVDFHDPTTNVRGRRALAIAKPTPRGY